MQKIFQLPIVKFFRQRYLTKNEQFWIDNRVEVRLMYRNLHKLIPSLFLRQIEVQAKLSELRWIFKNQQNEKFISNIQESKQVGYEVIQKINSKEYPPFPQWYPNSQPQTLTINAYDKKGKYLS